MAFKKIMKGMKAMKGMKTMKAMKSMKAMKAMKAMRFGFSGPNNTATNSVVAALKASDLAEATKKMLCRALKMSLPAYADERHEYQQGIVQMAEQALVDIERKLDAAVTAAREKVTSIDEDKLQHAVSQRARFRAQLKGTAASAEAALVEATMSYKKAQEALAAALTRQRTEDAEYTKVAATKAKFDQMVERLTAMKTNQNTNRAVSQLETELKSFGVDTSIAATLHNVLVKQPTGRTEFDNVTLVNLDADLASKANAVNAQFNVLLPGRDERSAAVAAAQAARDATQQQVATAKQAVSESSKSAFQSEESVNVAEEELKDMKKNLRDAQAAVEAAVQQLADFQSGPLQIFRELASGNRPVQVAVQAEGGMDVC